MAQKPWLRLVPTLPWLLDRNAALPAPWPLKAAVIAMVWSIFSSFNGARRVDGISVFAVSCLTVLAVCAIGYWNMKRWALISATLVLVLGGAMVAARSLAAGSARGAAFALILRVLILAPGVIYWRRMTWT